jgi:hypothetical protein
MENEMNRVFARPLGSAVGDCGVATAGDQNPPLRE